MDLIFNELSENPLCANKKEAFGRVDQMISTFKKANEFGFNKVRFHKGFESISFLQGYTLNDYCKEPQNRTKGILLRGLYKSPFIDENSTEEDEYITTSFSLEKDGESINPYGLAAAYVYNVPAIGFLFESFWNDCFFDLSLKTDRGETIEKVYCLSKPEHLEDQSIVDFIQRSTPIQLLESTTLPENKPIHFRADHGTDVLKAFANRIKQSKYVEGVLNSLPFNGQCTDFIRRVNPNGTIEIVLTKTDKGFGMLVQTTGRNLRETEAIAKEIEEEYY